MEPFGEFWDPVRSIEPPDGYVPYDTVTEQPHGLHRRMYALVILLAIGTANGLLVLMSLLPGADEVEWATLSPNGGFRYLVQFLLSLAAFVLCARGMLLGQDRGRARCARVDGVDRGRPRAGSRRPA